MAFLVLLGVFSVVLLTYFLYKGTQRPHGVPPGPPRVPVLGNLHTLSKEPSKDFLKLRKIYGDIFSFDFGPFPTVILNNIHLVKESFTGHSATGRPSFRFIKERYFGKKGGLIFNDGIDWVDQRRFVLKNLRDFGFGKRSMEVLVQEEIKELIETFRKSSAAKEPISTQNKFNAAVLNALWSIVSGNRYSHDDPVLGLLIEQLTSSIRQSKTLGFTVFFPRLRYILPKSITGGIDYKERQARMKRTTNFMRETVKNHVETFQPDAPPRDFIDVYLGEIQRTTNESSSFYDKEGERNLFGVMNDLFAAGAETTSTTLTWEFLLLAVHQDVQQKLFEEIKDVVGLSRLPSLADRPMMPYTEAVIMEVQRFGAITPMAVQHRATEDFHLEGYRIPKDTLVIANLWGILHDPEVWGDPETFRPERFISSSSTSSNDKKVVHPPEFIPFSTGKRVCLGETLARDELFLFTTSLFQRFHVQTDPSSPRPSLESHPAPVLMPKPHLLLLNERFNDSNN